MQRMLHIDLFHKFILSLSDCDSSNESSGQTIPTINNPAIYEVQSVA